VIEQQGERLTVAARLGVVLACGGFPSNQELTRHTYAHRRAGKNHVTLPPSANAGDGLRLAQSVGGRFNADVQQAAAWTPVSLVPQPDGRLLPFPHFYERGKPGYISVDRRGRRFVNESKSYHVYVPELIEACREDPVIEAWIVCDHTAIRRFGLGALGPAPMPMAAFLTSGYIKRADNVRALAQACGIDADGLERTLAAFNVAARRGEAPTLTSASTVPPATFPIPASPRWKGRHSTRCACFRANLAPLPASPPMPRRRCSITTACRCQVYTLRATMRRASWAAPIRAAASPSVRR
jgi:succinate dehydrogenase/fumarate reductase flavoprotein subunit